ncbi:mechanosensitive ion channel family protein [Thermoactinomyces sp. DSM 45892]|uniref:mechanosensitive ion channel family protein n=1 Tax=Thermoactinomyces sp. DSM 45892 TaxID=1882753 RepID=UPI00089A6746|nr:mechanosensitive ion channel family protein [Thermoactinomyces sp. DSM 45892]SDZ26429.1 small conductance mechanosensitive channel [Thermoactinomyces sp. DSM 45892]
MFPPTTPKEATTTAATGDILDGFQSFWDRIPSNPMNSIVFPFFNIVLVMFLAWLVVRVLDKVIDQAFSLGKVENRTAKTLVKLIKSISHYVIYFIAALTVLAKIGINLGPVLAGAGILGLAIGFGAQNLVRDIITGFFMIFERQLEVGDVVQINGQINGTVEEVGLRITKIREYNQRLHYLPNGTITQVTNYNREKMRAIVPVTVPPDSDLDIVDEALKEACMTVKEEYKDQIISDPEVVGITNMDVNGVQFTITTIATPEEYFIVERAMRKEAVLSLHKRGITIATPRSVVVSTDQLKGSSKKNR